MGIYLNDAELEAIGNWEPVLVKAYVWLRSRMDRTTRIVGRVTTISLAALAERMDYQIRKGQGWQWIRLGETPQQRKDAAARLLERLEKAGALRKLGGAFLCFLCPMVDEAPVRSNQTGHERATPFPTERTTAKGGEESSNGAGFEGFEWRNSTERTTPENEQNSPNEPHIIGQGNTSTPQSPSTVLTGVDAGDGGAGGAYRDRPTASQAGSLGRPGNPHETPNRDRPAGSHPAHAGRSGSGAEPVCERLHAGQHEAPAGLAENGLAPLDVRPAAEAALVAVLSRRGVRVPKRKAGEADAVAVWVAEQVTPLELDGTIDKALKERAKAASVQPINVGYVGQIIRSERGAVRRAAAAARKAASEGRKASGNQAFEDLARSLGMYPARTGESWGKWRERVYAAAAVTVGGDGA